MFFRMWGSEVIFAQASTHELTRPAIKSGPHLVKLIIAYSPTGASVAWVSSFFCSLCYLPSGAGGSGLGLKGTGNNSLVSGPTLFDGLLGDRNVSFSPFLGLGWVKICKGGFKIFMLVFLPKKGLPLPLACMADIHGFGRCTAWYPPRLVAPPRLRPWFSRLPVVLASFTLSGRLSSNSNLPLPWGAFPQRLWYFLCNCGWRNSRRSWLTPAFADASRVTASMARLTCSCLVMVDILAYSPSIIGAAGTLARAILPWMARSLRSRALSHFGTAAITSLFKSSLCTSMLDGLGCFSQSSFTTEGFLPSDQMSLITPATWPVRGGPSSSSGKRARAARSRSPHQHPHHQDHRDPRPSQQGQWLCNLPLCHRADRRHTDRHLPWVGRPLATMVVAS